MKLRSLVFIQQVVSLALLVLAGTVYAADFDLVPSITVNEEYTDNISENEERTRGAEFITRAIPGLKLSYAAPFWVWDVSYKLEYRYYAQNKRKPEDLHNLSAKTRMSLIDEKFFIDLTDEYSRVSLDQSRDRTQESLFANQSDQNNFMVSPNFVFRPTTKLILTPGVFYQNIWYKDPAGVNRDIYGARLNSEYVVTDKLSLISNYFFIWTDARGNISKNHNALAGIKLEYADKSFISVQGGYSWFMNSQQTSNNPLWTLAANYAGERYNIRAGAGQTYSNDPTTNNITLNTNYDVGFEWTYGKGKLGLGSGIVKLEDLSKNSTFSTSYNNAASMSYEILTDWVFDASYSFNYIDISHSNTFTTVSLLNTGINYNYSKNTKINFYYKNLHMFSPDIPVDNKTINTFILGISKIF